MPAIPVRSFAHREEFQTARYRVLLSPDVAYSDLFVPSTWEAVREILRPYDVVRVIAGDESFDVELTVVRTSLAGAVMRLKNKLPGEDAGKPRLVPAPVFPNGSPAIRIQFTPASRWRLLNFDKEIKRDMSKPEADEALDRYLREAGFVKYDA